MQFADHTQLFPPGQRHIEGGCLESHADPAANRGGIADDSVAGNATRRAALRRPAGHPAAAAITRTFVRLAAAHTVWELDSSSKYETKDRNTATLWAMNSTRKKTTIYVDPELLRAAKVFAASTGRHEYEVLEDALRRYLSDATLPTSRDALRTLLDQVATRADLSDEEALRLANAELHEARSARHRP